MGRKEGRLHYIDDLRALALLFVVAVHASIPFTTTGGWPIHDAHTSFAFDALVVFNHTFSIPLFFVVSGFFAHLVCEKRGVCAFLIQRGRRILVPLLVAMVTIVPAARAVGIYGRLRLAPPEGRPAVWPAIVEHFSSGRFFRTINAFHLWFLFDLLWITAAALAVGGLVTQFAPSVARVVDDLMRRAAGRAWFPLALAVLTLPLLWPMHAWASDHRSGFASPLRILLYHGAFFALGWRLQHQPVVVAAFGRYAGRFLILGILICFPAYLLILVRANHASTTWRLMALSLYTMIVWLIILGLVGWLAIHHKRPNAITRYVADASYWIYLVHYPVVGLGQVLIAPVALPAGLKFAAVLAGSVPLLFLSYHCLVRYTFIGVWLNGRRQPRSADGVAQPAML